MKSDGYTNLTISDIEVKSDAYTNCQQNLTVIAYDL